MLNRLNAYYSKIKHFYSKDEASTVPGFCCIYINSNHVCLAYIKDNEKHQSELQFVDAVAYKKKANLVDALSSIVRKRQLSGVECSWVLQAEHYQLLSMDALPVADSEFQAAIRWKVKDLIQIPIEDVVIDSFPMPMQKTHNPHKVIMVAAARLSYLQDIVDQIQSTGLHLTTIDISELALRNITSLYENDEKTTVLIYLKDDLSDLIITCQKTLYFYRTLDVGLEQLKQYPDMDPSKDSNPSLDKLALELQRSFDYYQAQWRLPAPSRIFLATTTHSTEAIVDYLSLALAIPVQTLNLNDVMLSKQTISQEQQGEFLAVIGGALRGRRNDSAS